MAHKSRRSDEDVSSSRLAGGRRQRRVGRGGCRVGGGAQQEGAAPLQPANARLPSATRAMQLRVQRATKGAGGC